jgi:hypothetical protein
MSDINEFARSVVRIPVAGPAPNNTLVYVRAQFPPSSTPITTSTFEPLQLFTVTLYQIAGFDQSRAHEYVKNTQISVTGWLNLGRTVGDQEIGFAIDRVWGSLTDDGHVAITADTAAQASDYATVHDFWLSAYILTQEPEQDFSRPPIDWTRLVSKSFTDRSFLHAAGVVRRPLGKDEALVTSPFSGSQVIRDCDP